MFSVRQKREISEAVQKILRDTNHPELPEGEISFNLHVSGAEAWSWADIQNNAAVYAPGVNLWNEKQDPCNSASNEVSSPKDILKMKPPIGFKALWDRRGTIYIDVQKCDACHKEEMCLCIDSSEEEYGPGCVCKQCVLELFECVETDLELEPNPITEEEF